MLYTTFAKAKVANGCIESYRKFAKFKGGVTKWGKDTPIPLSEVLEVCGLEDTIWCLGCTIEPAENIMIEFACQCAEHVLHLYEVKYPDDKRPRQTIAAARACITDKSTSAKRGAREVGDAGAVALATTWDAARDAGDASVVAWATGDAGDTARDAWAAWATGDAGVVAGAAWAARAAWDTGDAGTAARAVDDATRAAAWSAAWVTARAAWDAGAIAGDVGAAWDAGAAAETKWQTKTLRALLEGG